MENCTPSFLSGTLSKIIDPGDPLPVTLAYITQHMRACSIQLEWKTAFESNFIQFELQRSSDGKKFQTIVSMPASGI